MQEINDFLSQIQDGTWHNLNTLAESSQMSKHRLEKLCKLLTEPGIVEYRLRRRQVRIKEKWKNLLDNTDGQ